VLRLKAGKGPAERVHDEEQRQQVQSGVQVPGGVGGPEGLIVHHDQDSVYTSYRWLRQLLIEDKAVVSFCERGAKDNPKNL